MRVRHLIAGSLAVAALASPAMGQRFGAPAFHPPPAAAAPPVMSPPPASVYRPIEPAAPAITPAAPSSSDYAKPERSLDDSAEENRRLSREYDTVASSAASDSGSGGSYEAYPAPAKKPATPGYSDLCRATPKPPWCDDQPAQKPQ